MALKTKLVQITDDGRDKGKNFFITEMPASRFEKWCARAILAISRAKIEPDDIPENAGIAGVAALGLKMFSRMEFGEAEVLLDEMFRCIEIVPDLEGNPNFKRAMVENDIEELWTRLHLRSEWWMLHVGFSMADALSRLNSMNLAPAGSSNTPTSPA